MNKRQQSAVILLSTVAFALAGCSSNKDAAPPIPENLNSLQASDPQQEHLDQLDSWLFPPVEAETARRAFVSRCVSAANGGTYEEAEISHNLSIVPPGGVTTETLKATGYQPTAQSTSSYSPPVNSDNGLDAYAGNLKKGTLSTSFLGYDSGEIAIDGCQAQSYQYIYGSVENGLKAVSLAPSFANAITEEVTSDEDYNNLQNDWSSCMEDKGYQDLSNAGAASDLALRSSKSDSQKISKADIACRESLDYDNKFSSIENKYYETVYERVQKFGDELNQIHDTGKQNAEKDKTDPKDTSPVSNPTESASATPTDSESSHT